MPEIKEGSILEISSLPNTMDRQNFMDWLKEHEVDMILIENMMDTDIPSTKLVKGLSSETQKWIIGKMDGRTYEGKSLRFTSVIMSVMAQTSVVTRLIKLSCSVISTDE